MADEVNTMHDQRNADYGFDLNKIDYQWIEKTSNVKELKAAYDALELDGYFPDLMKACGERIITLKPNDAPFRLRFLGAPKLSAAEEKAVNDDLFSFLDDVNKTDNSLRNLNK